MPVSFFFKKNNILWALHIDGPTHHHLGNHGTSSCYHPVHTVKHPQNPKHAWSGNKNIINSNSAMHETVKEKSKTPDQTKSFPLS